MKETVHIFQVFAVAIAFSFFFREGRCWHFEEAKFKDNESVFPRLPKAIFAYEKVKTKLVRESC